MGDPIAYAFSVVVLPALIATVVAVPVLVGPLRRRGAAIECAVAFALALAFLLSFVRELDANAIARQFTTIEGDRFPVERWHRLGLAAAILALAAPLVSVARAMDRRNAARFVTIATVVVAAALAGFLIEFPRPTLGGQVLQSVTCALAALGFARFSRNGALWSAWIVFAVLAVMLVLGGFARLAVMSAATSAAAFGIASAAFVGSRATRDPEPVEGSGATALVLGMLVGLVASCGRAYDQAPLPTWLWTAVALIPFASIVFARAAGRAPSRGATAFWRVLGAALLAAALLAAIAWSQFGGATEAADESGDPMQGIYGG